MLLLSMTKTLRNLGLESFFGEKKRGPGTWFDRTRCWMIALVHRWDKRLKYCARRKALKLTRCRNTFVEFSNIHILTGGKRAIRNNFWLIVSWQITHLVSKSCLDWSTLRSGLLAKIAGLGDSPTVQHRINTGENCFSPIALNCSLTALLALLIEILILWLNHDFDLRSCSSLVISWSKQSAATAMQGWEVLWKQRVRLFQLQRLYWATSLRELWYLL